eukprot:12927690-Prorocentrum_lima.AAC.1
MSTPEHLGPQDTDEKLKNKTHWCNDHKCQVQGIRTSRGFILCGDKEPTHWKSWKDSVHR